MLFIRRRIEVNNKFSRGKKLRHVPFFLRRQRNDEIGWTNWMSNRLLFCQLRMFRHRPDPWPPGPLGPFFKPFRLEKAHSAPPSHLCFLLVQLLPHCLSETRDSTRVHSFALGSGTHTPIHLSPFSFCLAVVMPSHPSSSCSIPSSSCSVLPLLPSFL